MQTRKIADLKPYENNARTHSQEQIAEIGQSIREFGFNNPVLIDEKDNVIAGHGRIMAAKQIGMDTIPVMVLSHLSDTKKRAYILADNRIALNAGWSPELLRAEFESLLNDGFDVTLTGFTQDEIDAFLNPQIIVEGNGDPDAVPDIVPDPVTVPGDVWLLGNHRLMCGDSTMIDQVEKLINGEKVEMVFTDPPYGIKIVETGSFSDGKQYGSMKAKHGEYDAVKNDDSTKTAHDVYRLCKGMNIKTLIFWGANFYPAVLDEGMSWLVWDKNTCAPSFSECEIAFVNKVGKLKLFKHQWSGMIKDSERGEKRCHPTQKPVALAEWCFQEYGKEAKSILDLFGGSGSTLIACEKTGRKCLMMELSPQYCDVIVSRWQKFTGQDAKLDASGLTFNEVKDDCERQRGTPEMDPT